jgi:RNA-directed DNA polymerase
MRVEDTAGSSRAASCAVSRLGDRPGDVDSTNDRSTPTTPTTPGTRTSTTATRTGTTSATQYRARAVRIWKRCSFSFEELVQAYFDCRQHKRNTLARAPSSATSRRTSTSCTRSSPPATYQPGPSICFVVERPKVREVWAAASATAWSTTCSTTRSARASSARSSPTAAPASRAAARSTPPSGWRRRSARSRATGRAGVLPEVRHRELLRLDRQAPPGAAGARAKVTEPFWLDLAMRVLFHDPRPRARCKARPPSSR